VRRSRGLPTSASAGTQVCHSTHLCVRVLPSWYSFEIGESIRLKVEG
jgi:hypothetical protein